MGAVAERQRLRKTLRVPLNAILLVSVGELNHNKNHESIIRAMAKLGRPDIHYAIAGKGELWEYLQSLAAELGMSERVHLLGYRTDIPQLYKCADVCVFPSIREGLGLAAIEGMAAGLPLIAADNRGTREYAAQGEDAFVCRYDDVDGFADAIARLADDVALRSTMGRHAMKKAEQFGIDAATKRMKSLYALADSLK